jgi:hypothetical protein
LKTGAYGFCSSAWRVSVDAVPEFHSYSPPIGGEPDGPNRSYRLTNLSSTSVTQLDRLKLSPALDVADNQYSLPVISITLLRGRRQKTTVGAQGYGIDIVVFGHADSEPTTRTGSQH